MSTFLSDLERELRDAHPRRRAARRRAAAARAVTHAPIALLVVAVLAGATAFVVSVGGESSRQATHEGPDRAMPPAGDPLGAGSVAVLNATKRPGLAAEVADYLGDGIGIAHVGNGPYASRGATTVAFAPGSSRKAQRIAERLGSVPTQPLDEPTRAAARGAEVVVEVGLDVHGAEVTPLLRVADRVAVGRAAVLDRRGAHDVVSLSARMKRTGQAAVWLDDPHDDAPAGHLGFVASDSRRTLEVTFSAPRTRGRRLIVSRERSAIVGMRPHDPVLVADL